RREVDESPAVDIDVGGIDGPSNSSLAVKVGLSKAVQVLSEGRLPVQALTGFVGRTHGTYAPEFAPSPVRWPECSPDPPVPWAPSCPVLGAVSFDSVSDSSSSAPAVSDISATSPASSSMAAP